MKSVITMNENVQKELNFNSWLLSLIFLIVGSVGLAVYLVLGTIGIENYLIEMLLLISAILFGFGLVFLIHINKTNKTNPNLGIVVEYEFFNDYMTYRTLKNGEERETGKFLYKDSVKIKETKSYIFLYQTKVSAFPIQKDTLSEVDLKILRDYLGLKNKK